MGVKKKPPVRQYLLKNYVTPGHPSFLQGMTGWRQYVHNTAKGKRISAGHLKQWQSSINAYARHRQTKRPRTFNPIFVYNRRELLQIDLADVSQLAKQNNGVKYLLTAIDTFSRKAWVKTLQNKLAESVLLAFQSILDDMSTPLPKKLLCDQGKEFKNKDFLDYLSQINMPMIHLYSAQKAAHVERFNGTLKRLVFSYLTLSQSKRYFDALPKLLQTYNSRVHRAIGMSPNMADLPRNHTKVLETVMQTYNKVRRKRKKPVYQVGDKVYVQKADKKFKRGYEESFRTEVFEVDRVDTGKIIPLYFLKDIENEPVEGGWYAEELQYVPAGEQSD